MMIESIVAFAGVAMSLGYYPQAYKIWRTKSTQGISWHSILIFALGNLVWSVYGIIRHDWTIITSFIFGLIGSWLVLIQILIYRRKEELHESAVASHGNEGPHLQG